MKILHYKTGYLIGKTKPFFGIDGSRIEADEA